MTHLLKAFDFSEVDWVPAWKAREVRWTWMTQWDLSYVNPLKNAPWEHGDYIPLYGVYISWKRYVVGEDTEWNKVLLCDGHPTKIKTFAATLMTISQIGQQLHLRLANSQYGNSVYPVKLQDGSITFISGMQIEGPALFWEAQVRMNSNESIKTILWWLHCSNPYTYLPAEVVLEDEKRIKLPEWNPFQSLSINDEVR